MLFAGLEELLCAVGAVCLLLGNDDETLVDGHLVFAVFAGCGALDGCVVLFQSQ